jgi:hypothetical protein
MRMTFQRMADRRPVETEVERDDGVVFAMRGAGGGADLPHDLVHAVVESALPLADGVWGCIADGVVWGSMRHVSGRRPPHAGQRSDRLQRERVEAVRLAEGLAHVVGRLAHEEEVLPNELMAPGIPRQRIEAAVEAVREAARRWTAMSVGECWVWEWTLPVAGGGRRRPPR